MEVSVHPQPKLYFNQGLYLFAMSEFALSTCFFQQCLERDEGVYYTPSANLCLAKTYSVMGDKEAAAQHLRTVNDEACLRLGWLVKASELRQQFLED